MYIYLHTHVYKSVCKYIYICVQYIKLHVYVCLVATAKKVCVIHGDPHYHSFDGPVHDYQGTGEYHMSERQTASCLTLQDFIVIGYHKMFPDRQGVTFLMWMELHVFLPSGTTRVKIGQALQVWVSVQLFLNICFVKCRYYCK